jgi:hypothetical protein
MAWAAALPIDSLGCQERPDVLIRSNALAKLILAQSPPPGAGGHTTPPPPRQGAPACASCTRPYLGLCYMVKARSKAYGHILAITPSSPRHADESFGRCIVLTMGAPSETLTIISRSNKFICQSSNQMQSSNNELSMFGMSWVVDIVTVGIGPPMSCVPTPCLGQWQTPRLAQVPKLSYYYYYYY